MDFERAIELDNTNPVVYSNLGLLYRKNEYFQKAIVCYTKEIELSGFNLKSLNNRA